MERSRHSICFIDTMLLMMASWLQIPVAQDAIVRASEMPRAFAILSHSSDVQKART
jgi:uncharacterized protein YqcC (DUF446 family)